MDYGNLIQTAISVLAIAALAGVGFQRGKVNNLRDNLKDAREEIADKGRRLVECETESAKHTADLAALTRVVTGEAHWVALGDQLTDHHKESMVLLREIKRLLERPKT